MSFPHVPGLTLQISPHRPYTMSSGDTKFGQDYGVIAPRVISRHGSPALRELGNTGERLQLDLGPQFGIDTSEFDVIFEPDASSPLSPFSDDQDDSEHSDSYCSSQPRFPTFESLASLVDIDGWETDNNLDYAAEGTPSYPYQTKLPSDPTSFTSPSVAYDGDTDILDEKFGDWDLSTGTVVSDIFLQDLQRMLPRNVAFEFDSVLLKDLDARLLLDPREAFDDVCWAEISQPNDSARWRSLPDVPSCLVDNGNDPIDAWAGEYETSPIWVNSASSLDMYNYYSTEQLISNEDNECHPFAMSDE